MHELLHLARNLKTGKLATDTIVTPKLKRPRNAGLVPDAAPLFIAELRDAAASILICRESLPIVIPAWQLGNYTLPNDLPRFARSSSVFAAGHPIIHYRSDVHERYHKGSVRLGDAEAGCSRCRRTLSGSGCRRIRQVDHRRQPHTAACYSESNNVYNSL